MNAHTPRQVPTAEPAASDRDGWIGRVLDDRYRVVQQLGEGGMGAVYVAEHLKLRKLVALKVIHPEFAGDGEVAARFAREAMASAQLEHPHVASALDFGTLPEGGAYLVMQLVRGQSVHELVEESGALPWQQACEIAAQVADALAAAHANGIVHRDLKPDNILLARRDDGSMQVKVLDFGIARVAMEEGRHAPEGAEPGRALTRVGTVMGTPGYMSPEQAMGERVDARTDLYALGVVLWEMLVGRDMFGTRDLTVIVTKQLTEAAPRLGENAPKEVPAQLDALVAQMLASRATERPESAASVRDQLRRMVFGTTGPVSGMQLLPPAQRDRSEATAETMLVKGGEAPATGPLPRQRTSMAVPTIITLPGLKRRVRTSWLATGCGALLLVAGATTVAVVAMGGEEEGTEPTAQTSAPPFTLKRLLELSPLPAPAPTVLPEVQERIDLLLEGEDRRVRREAADWLLLHEPPAEVPSFALAAAELEKARGCRAKKLVVERIREEELSGALPAIERLARSPRRGCGFLGVNDCHSCMRRELRRTVVALGGSEDLVADGDEEDEPN